MKIILNNAGKRFSREWIFRNLHYEFYSGRSYAVTGPNGSGKSTFLQILSASLLLNEGKSEWIINDTNIESETVHQHIAFAAPYLELVEEMTAAEFLLFHSKFKKFIGGVLIEDILNMAGLHPAANKQIRFFSSGMKQRLKLAQAIFSDVPLILLDEPCTNLDASGFELYYTWIDKFCKERLLIIASNDVNEYRFCNEEIKLQIFKPQKLEKYPDLKY
jgi:ABC-type multidrug transport system ATPase subunit